ncbi:MAG: diguanylate cyclase [Thermacetogeniaceae bacterium]|jgi:diguanylate cyclase (GGDEF)-like protein
MRDWETKRANEISENILVTHIISLLIFMMIIFSLFGAPLGQQIQIQYQTTIILIIFCLGIVIYIARKLLARFTFMDQPRIDEILLLAITLPITFGFFWYSKGFIGGTVLLIIPAIITAIAFGKVAGVGEALLSCGLLFLLDHILYGTIPAGAFQANLIITGVTTLMAWVVGGLIEVERRTQQELLKLADYDPLTGLINYRFLQERLAVSLRQAVAGAYPLSLALLDIDQLNYYNQVYGYQKGDEILRVIGGLLQEEVREPCYAARYGSDEFMLVLPGQDKPSARRIAGGITEKLVRQATATLLENRSTASWRDFTISTGLACCPDGGNAVLQLIRSAEDDLFRVRYSKADYMYHSVVSEISTLSVRDAFPTLHTFITMINYKDRYTHGHSERVIAYSLAIGDRLGLTEFEMDILRFSAYLHDIGKIEIDNSILNKAEDLEGDEWDFMMNHPIHGSELLKPLVAYLPLVPIIRSHHENYDGSGYPDGRRGEDIPLLARIIRIADSFDAMTTCRPYRRAMILDEACAELKAYAGSRYDTQLVYMFLDIVKNIYQPAC